MKQGVLLVLGLALCASGAPVEQGAGMETGSCQDAQALGAAGLALTEINKDRQEGYILSLYRMANVNMMKHGETGVVFYLTLDVVETNCHVLSRKDWKKCEARSSSQTPVYGQCKATIFISKVHRVVRLYKYDCTIRPVPSEKVVELCPDCPTRIAKDSEIILSTASKSLEKYNKESGLANRFAMRNVTLATASMGGMAMFYNVEYTVQETSCANNAETKTEDCPIMECEFAHKGHCKGSFSRHPDGEDISVECEIYEPEAAEEEKKHHLLGEKTDHSHSDAHTEGGVDQTHDAAHDATQGSHPHDHVHDHTKSHKQHDATQVHADDSEHHHTHDHEGGMTHSHAHSHDHGHGHDHVHAHHAKAHDHSGDLPNQHHKYHDASAPHTHEHDHEIALDHDHKHAHLHDHEHHHHHHEHTHCPTRIAKDSEIILSTASKSLEKYNKESGLANRFAMRNVTLATASMGGMAMVYNVEYTVQETSCANNAETKTEDCPIMECEFAHKGHCKGSFSRHPGGEDIFVECEIYEPEAAEEEKKHHLLGEKTDHSHSDAHTEGGVDQTHDAAHDATQGSHPHDHVHDHTKSHKQHEATQVHADDSEHHHTHDHEGGMTHSHAHSHDHGHGHDHVHAHHAKAHDHSGDLPNQHHKYHDASAPHTHEHDHEIALDHDHKHAHLHEHEHHHHHHEHTHHPDQPVGGPEEGVTLPLIPDPDIPGQREPTILPFPTAVASDCPALVPTQAGVDLVAKMFAEDPMFKAAA